MPQDAAQYKDRLYRLRRMLMYVLEADDLYLTANTPEKADGFKSLRAIHLKETRTTLKEEIEAMDEDEPGYDDMRKLLEDL